MSLKEDITAIEGALSEAGANLDRMLVAAGVNRSTWTRWKNGSVTGARYDTFARVRAAADVAIREARAAGERAPEADAA